MVVQRYQMMTFCTFPITPGTSHFILILILIILIPFVKQQYRDPDQTSPQSLSSHQVGMDILCIALHLANLAVRLVCTFVKPRFRQ
jgi:hypothetical protein